MRGAHARPLDRTPTPRTYFAQPAQGSGPGLLLCSGEREISPTMRSIADVWGEEGYTVLAISMGADLAAALRTLRSLPTCKGKLAALGYKDGNLPALQAAATRLVDGVILIDPPNPEQALVEIADLPALLHLAGLADSASPPNGKTYCYPDVVPGFTLPDDPAYNHAAAGMAYSRTLAFLRRELGPHYDLDALWEAHRACEFITRDADATMRTMVAEPYVNHVPTMTGGFGQIDLHRFYRDHFIPNNPKDMRNIPISRTVGSDRVVNEGILCFTHDRQIDWLLPGVPPTGKYVEVALIGIITFRGDKLIHEHIYWDQASVLVQIGLLDPTGLPVAGAAAARKVMNPALPSNELLPGWVPTA